MRAVLVTREAEQGRATAARLRALGHRPVLLPLWRIEDTGIALPCERPSGVLLTSANAARLLGARLARGERADWVGLAAHCVGGATAAAARAAGLEPVIVTDGGGAALAAALVRAMPQGRLLYLAPREPAFDLVAALASAGLAAESLPFYDAVPVDPGAAALHDALDEAEGGVVLHYSARGVEHLADLLERHGGADRLRAMDTLAIAPAVADRVATRLRQGARCPSQPGEAAMLALMRAEPALDKTPPGST